MPRSHYPQPLPAADLPLRPNEVLIEFALGEAESFVFVVRKGGVKRLIKIPRGREQLEATVKAFMEPLINREPDRFSLKQAQELYALLLAQALGEVKENERVIIVPDGILGLLPFEALAAQDGTGLKDSVFVGDRYTLSYYQSAAVMALKRRLPEHRAGRPLFALGNPVFSPEDPRWATGLGGDRPRQREVRGAARPPSGPWPPERTGAKPPGTAKPGRSWYIRPSRKPTMRSWPSPGCGGLTPNPRTCS